MAATDTINRVYRENNRYTGDGLPGEPLNAPLPVGDPSSGPHQPKKSSIRTALIETIDGGAEAAQEVIDEAMPAINAAVASAEESAAQANASEAQAQVWAEAAEEAALPNSFTNGLTAAAGSLAALRGMDSNRYKSVELFGDVGRAGHFDWNPASLTSIIAAKSITSTAVDASTETITSAAHGLRTGDNVVATTSVNGLTAGTRYFVIRVSADTFRLAISYANAVAGTAINLTATTNFTVRRLGDPSQGVYVIPNGAPIDGSAGAWVRRNTKRVDVRWCGAVADGVTSNTEAINNAFELAATLGNGSVHVPAGTWALNGEIYVYRLTPMITDGAEVTIFKNLSLISRALYFERHGNFGPVPGLNTSFIALSGGFTLDQNGSNADGLTLRAQHTTVSGQVIVRNQGGGAGKAVLLDGCTLIDFEYLSLILCGNGLKLVNCYYPHFGRAALEVNGGAILHVEDCVCTTFNDVYVDPGSTADARTAGVIVINSTDITFQHLTGEIANSGTYANSAFFYINTSVNLNILSGRFHVDTPAYPNISSFFYLDGVNTNFNLLNFIAQSQKTGSGAYYLVRLNQASDYQAKSIKIRDCNVDFNNSGGRYLFYNDTRTVEKLSISGCWDMGLVSQIYFRAITVLIDNFTGAITNDAGANGAGAQTTLINCDGAKSGLGSATLVNS